MENEATPIVEEVKVDIKEMRAAFPDNAEFALDAIERGISVLEAKAEYADVLLAERNELAEELAELQAAMEDKGDADGEIPVEYQEEQVQEFAKDTPEAEFSALVKDARAKFDYSEQDAINHVIRNNPQIADKLI